MISKMSEESFILPCNSRNVFELTKIQEVVDVHVLVFLLAEHPKTDLRGKIFCLIQKLEGEGMLVGSR